MIFEKIITPWLHDNFDFPDDFMEDDNLKNIYSVGMYAAEKAKISLSTQEESTIYMDENEVDCKDIAGKNIYFDIPFTRTELDDLIKDMVDETIEFSRNMMKDAGLSGADIEKLFLSVVPHVINHFEKKYPLHWKYKLTQQLIQ